MMVNIPHPDETDTPELDDMRILVCGGREYNDREAVERELRHLTAQQLGEVVVITGGYAGADSLAAHEAHRLGFHVAEVRALWETYDRAAGPRRNKAMLALQPTLVLAFPGGRGTADMIRQAEAAGIPVRKVGSDDV